jgi:hypothetical protein
VIFDAVGFSISSVEGDNKLTISSKIAFCLLRLAYIDNLMEYPYQSVQSMVKPPNSRVHGTPIVKQVVEK